MKVTKVRILNTYLNKTEIFRVKKYLIRYFASLITYFFLFFMNTKGILHVKYNLIQPCFIWKTIYLLRFYYFTK